MTTTSRKAVATVGHDVAPVTVAIRLEERREALDLMASLTAFHSFIVEHDRQRWVVHARVPGCSGETLDDLVATIERSGVGHLLG